MRKIELNVTDLMGYASNGTEITKVSSTKIGNKGDIGSGPHHEVASYVAQALQAVTPASES